MVLRAEEPGEGKERREGSLNEGNVGRWIGYKSSCHAETNVA